MDTYNIIYYTYYIHITYMIISYLMYFIGITKYIYYIYILLFTQMVISYNIKLAGNVTLSFI